MINLILVISLIIGAVALSGCVAPEMNNTTTNSSQNSTQTAASVNNTFENKYISFTKPEGLTIIDNSTNESLDVLFYKGDKFVAVLSSFGANPMTYQDIFSTGNNVTIAGKNSVESYETTINTYVNTGSNSGDCKVLINLEFDSDNSGAYNTVKDSLKIISIPPVS